MRGEKAAGGVSQLSSDQLNVIFNVIGTPKIEECDFIKDKSKISIIKEMPECPRKEFAEIYPSASPEAIDLLNKMIVFNPYKRLSVDQCLEHPFFAPIRKKEEELSSPSPLHIPFEEEGELDKTRLIELFKEDLDYFDAERVKGNIIY